MNWKKSIIEGMILLSFNYGAISQEKTLLKVKNSEIFHTVYELIDYKTLNKAINNLYLKKYNKHYDFFNEINAFNPIFKEISLTFNKNKYYIKFENDTSFLEIETPRYLWKQIAEELLVTHRVKEINQNLEKIL